MRIGERNYRQEKKNYLSMPSQEWRIMWVSVEVINFLVHLKKLTEEHCCRYGSYLYRNHWPVMFMLHLSLTEIIQGVVILSFDNCLSTVESVLTDTPRKGHCIKYLSTMDKTKSPNFIPPINIMLCILGLNISFLNSYK